MAKHPLPLTVYTEEQHAQARFDLLRLFLEDGVPLTQIAKTQHLPLRTARRWADLYRTYALLDSSNKRVPIRANGVGCH